MTKGYYCCKFVGYRITMLLFRQFIVSLFISLLFHNCNIGGVGNLDFEADANIGEKRTLCMTLTDKQTKKQLVGVSGTWYGERIEDATGWGPIYYSISATSNENGEICFKYGSFYETIRLEFAKNNYVTICEENFFSNELFAMDPVCYLLVKIKNVDSLNTYETTAIWYPNVNYCVQRTIGEYFSGEGLDTSVIKLVPPKFVFKIGSWGTRMIEKEISVNYGDTALVEVLF